MDKTNMHKVNSSSLFHFTRNLQTLKQILKKGLRYSYSVEEKPETNNNSKGKIIIPMICFCDIPLMRTSIHRGTYGNYCIGLDKYFLKDKLKETLNPVSYYNSIKTTNALNYLYEFSDTMISEGLEELKNEPILSLYNNNFSKGNRIQKELKYILAYYKPCYKLSENNIVKDYTDEREWRAVLEENKAMQCDWNFNASEQPWNKEKGIDIARNTANICNEYINHITYFFLQLTENEISKSLTHILTKKEKEIPSIVDFILKSESLFGCKDVSNDLRKVLVSKITSFERIEKDF